MKNMLVENKIQDLSKKYDVDASKTREIVKDVLGLRSQGYSPASEIEKLLNLEAGFFSRSLSRGSTINAHIVKEDNNILVKINKDIQSLLLEGYIAMKISKDEMESFDIVRNLTKKTLLGFYK